MEDPNRLAKLTEVMEQLVADDPTYESVKGKTLCLYCCSDVVAYGKHDRDCPWLMAKTWLESKESGVT
jgi:hypothetical protein